MAKHNDIGTEGEKIARAFLVKEKFKILDCNYSFMKKEIDIVALKNNRLHIVEVKTSEHWKHEEPHKMVGKRKMNNLGIAAEAYLDEKDLDLEIQFDIIEVRLLPKVWLNWIPEAFIPTRFFN